MIRRRELLRRSILGAAAGVLACRSRAVGARPRKFPRHYDASKKLAGPDWKPVFLDAHQDRTVVALSDLIIPETETPGARAALVNRFIDHLLAAEDRETRSRFLAGLAYLDAACLEQYGKAFVHLPVKQQTAALAALDRSGPVDDSSGEGAAGSPGRRHFDHLKGWISRTYYSSEIGLMELGWDGTPVLGTFQGCPHPEGSHQEEGE